MVADKIKLKTLPPWTAEGGWDGGFGGELGGWEGEGTEMDM